MKPLKITIEYGDQVEVIEYKPEELQGEIRYKICGLINRIAMFLASLMGTSHYKITAACIAIRPRRDTRQSSDQSNQEKTQ